MIAASSSSGSGVTSEGLSTTQQPAAKAGASFHAVVTIGKFHGTIRPTTPHGSRRRRALKSSVGNSTALSCFRVQAFGQTGVILERGDHVIDVDGRFEQWLAVVARLQVHQLFATGLHARGDFAQDRTALGAVVFDQLGEGLRSPR